jgi:carboxymethylenebutenolidase
MNILQDYIVAEYVANYREGRLSRRDLIRRVMYITGGIASAAAVLSNVGLNTVAPEPLLAQAQGAGSPLSVPANDPSIVGSDITFTGRDGATIMAYQVRPANASGPLPLMLVVHQDQGLNEHIRDVTRRWAKNGYTAVAVDMLSRQGGTAAITDPNDFARYLMGPGVDPNGFVSDLAAAIDYYKTQPNLVDSGRIGMNGFCFGGGLTWLSVEQIPELKAAVPFYGAPPPLDQVKNIRAAVLGVYSSDPQDFANANRDALDAALTQARVVHQFNVYPGTEHAFNDDTQAVYNQQQALAAWGDAMAWFTQYLAPSNAPPPAGTAPTLQHDGRYFAQTGFRVDNDAFWTYFTQRGAVRTFGYPSSRTFKLDGFQVQIFQRLILQLQDNGSVQTLNLLDPGLMPYTNINGSTYPAPDPSVVGETPPVSSPTYSTDIITFTQQNAPDTFEGQPVNYFQTFSTTVTCADAFPNGDCQPNLLPGLSLEIWGAPTSKPAYDPTNRGFIYLRFQRGIMHFDASCGCTQGLLLADYFKAIMTGQNLPADLNQQAQGTKYYRQYDPTKPTWIARPNELPASDLTYAFVPG